jgi:hypothetical protein
MNFEAEAQKIIDGLDSNMRDTLDKTCSQLHLSPIEYVVRQLQSIEARKHYCQEEGVDYSSYREQSFSTQIKNIRDNLRNLIPKFRSPKSKP